MRTHTQPILLLATVVVTALILTLALSHGVAARTTFQSSLASPTRGIASPTVTPGATVPAPQASPQSQPFPTIEPPTAMPAPPPVLPAPTVSGFLPAPTIVNPNDPGSLPLAQPFITNPGGEPEPTPVVVAGNAGLLGIGWDLINLFWLACGGALIIGGAAAMILLMRRSGRL